MLVDTSFSKIIKKNSHVIFTFTFKSIDAQFSSFLLAGLLQSQPGVVLSTHVSSRAVMCPVCRAMSLA